MLKILGAMARRPDFAVFRRSLAIAGVDGTLKDRMRGTAAAGNVRAKTGTLNAASSLSGYVTTASGHTLSFSMLMNGDPVPLAQGARRPGRRRRPPRPLDALRPPAGAAFVARAAPSTLIGGYLIRLAGHSSAWHDHSGKARSASGWSPSR